MNLDIVSVILILIIVVLVEVGRQLYGKMIAGFLSAAKARVLHSRRERNLKQLFQLEFGAPPEHASLERVDLHLTELARNFYDACQEEERKRQRVNERIPGTSVFDLESAKANVMNYKNLYWRAHALAKAAGFRTFENHGDYLLADPTTPAEIKRALEIV